MTRLFIFIRKGKLFQFTSISMNNYYSFASFCPLSLHHLHRREFVAIGKRTIECDNLTATFGGSIHPRAFQMAPCLWVKSSHQGSLFTLDTHEDTHNCISGRSNNVRSSIDKDGTAEDAAHWRRCACVCVY